MKLLKIDALREAYSATECETMTVLELMALLDEMDENAPVVLRFDDGYCYGGLRKYMFKEEEA